MTPQQVVRYLDYCSEMLSLTSKVGALYAQSFPDPVVLDAVTALEQTAAGMSQKIWQKINIIHRELDDAMRADAIGSVADQHGSRSCIQSHPMDRHRLATIFRYWGDVEATANLSPLYAVFGHAVADDPDLLSIAAEALPGQPPPNVLFAAVHAFLATHPREPLADYYASLGGTRPADAHAAILLRNLCLGHQDELLPIIRTRLTQTNEVRRSAVLLPAFASVAADSGDEPLALIEIGPSAGLNLLFDRYKYRYGPVEIGDPNSPLLLESEVRGSVPNIAIPRVSSRHGIDINPLDVNDEADVAWLRALLWPEHTDRLALMNAAIEIARREPPDLARGDLFELLPLRVRAAPADSTICIFATFVLNQFSEELLIRLRDLLIEMAKVRPLYLVVMGFSEFIEPGTSRFGDTMVWILRLRNGVGEYRLSSLANPHGRWLDLRPDSPWQPWLSSIQAPK